MLGCGRDGETKLYFGIWRQALIKRWLGVISAGGGPSERTIAANLLSAESIVICSFDIFINRVLSPAIKGSVTR